MKLDVIKLDSGSAGSIELADDIFGLEPRGDILQRVVRWQRAKAQQGTHATLGKSDVSYSTKKIYRQKGTGGARHGSRKAPIFRKGGVYKGPTPRSHAFDLPKKVRALGLKMALSSKARDGRLVVVENLDLSEAKTKALKERLASFDLGRNALVIDGDALNVGFAQAAGNLREIDLIPAIGANVYDILNHDTPVLTRAAVETLEARFNG